MTDRTPPLPGQLYELVPKIDDDPDYTEAPHRDLIRNPEGATVTTSRVADKDGVHKLVLDIDLPAQLIPSTTPGHYHLYVDHEMPWTTYVALLHALADAGIIERGYAGASEARGHTAVRLPWVRKGAPGTEATP